MDNEYRLFPDILLVCSDTPVISRRNTAVISCCISGVCEYHTDSGYSYLTKGSCRIFRCSGDNLCKAEASTDCRIVSVLVDMKGSGTGFPEFIGIPDILRDTYTDDDWFFQDERITKTFSDICCELSRGKESLLRIKALELLMMLSEEKSRPCRREESIRKAGRYICSHISEHFTISQLSEMFAIDPTSLKAGFRQVLGCPVYTYAKSRKMFRAAVMLRETDMKIIDIAEEVGYTNASKFSKAFCDVMGVNPRYFRMEHKQAAGSTNLSISQLMAY